MVIESSPLHSKGKNLDSRIILSLSVSKEIMMEQYYTVYTIHVHVFLVQCLDQVIHHHIFYN